MARKRAAVFDLRVPTDGGDATSVKTFFQKTKLAKTGGRGLKISTIIPWGDNVETTRTS